jgi:glycosyltransferase involved in cell wall biosynthesis
MMLLVVTQEIEIEPFLINELKEISYHFSRVVIITKQKNITVTHNFETVSSKKTDYFFSCILYSITKLFSKEAFEELRDRRKMRIKPNFKLMVQTWIITWMIEKRLQKYLHKIWKGEKIILYSYWLNINAYFVAKVKKKYPDIIAISRAHGFEIRDFQCYIPFRRIIDTYLDKIIFISEFTKSEYESIMRRISTKKGAERRVIRLGVNNLAKLKKKDFIQKETLNIVSCSGIYKLKRLDLIIDSLQQISDSRKINWVHFGTGNDFERIFKYAVEKLKKSNIDFEFKGQLTNQDLLRFYETQEIDMFINTSDYEGIPVSIMEAMSFGIPCIGRDVGGNSEIIINQISGILLPKDSSPKLIASAIDGFFIQKANNYKQYLQLRESTYRFWEKNFHAATNYNVFLEYIMNKNS